MEREEEKRGRSKEDRKLGEEETKNEIILERQQKLSKKKTFHIGNIKPRRIETILGIKVV